jgi:hypothetical protein
MKSRLQTIAEKSGRPGNTGAFRNLSPRIKSHGLLNGTAHSALKALNHGLADLTVPMIQAKLKMGRPGDKFEQEADRVADRVMRMPVSGIQMQPT